MKDAEQLHRDRLLARTRRILTDLEVPMFLLAMLWIGLFVAELVWSLPPALVVLGTVIWATFGVEFALRLVLAPRKGAFLRRNALTAVSLLVPALRVLRIGRALAVARGARVLRFVGSVGRSRVALHAALRRKRLTYVVTLSLLLAFSGGAAIHSFERDAGHPVFRGFASAVWWTAMTVIGVGAEGSPTTWAGRVTFLLLKLYGFALIGYVTALVAAFLVGTDAEKSRPSAPPPQKEILDALNVLRTEVAAIRAAQSTKGLGHLPPPSEGTA